MIAPSLSAHYASTLALCRARHHQPALHHGDGWRTSVSVRPTCFSSYASAMSQASCIATSRLDAFKTWLTEQGVLSSNIPVIPQQVENQGLGIVAKGRSVAQNEDVLSVPQELWMSVAVARLHPTIGPFCQNLRPWVALALLLLYEKAMPSSFWRPYIDILPDTLDSPLFWSNEELMQLEGTQLLGSISGYLQHVDSEYTTLFQEVIEPNPGIFNTSLFSRDLFLWAFGILRSRTFPPLTGDELALVPFADLVNHGMVLNMDGPSWEKKSSGFFDRREYLTLRAPISVKEGEQIVMQYGKVKSNGKLAVDYGFVECGPKTTAIRDSFTLTLEIAESDRFFDDKIDIAELNGLSAIVYFDLVYEQGLPDNMLPFLRLIALSGTDAFLLEALFRNSVWDHLQLPVSRVNEEAVCKAIVDGCHVALTSYPSTIDEDLNLLQDIELSPRLKIAAAIRLGEKRVLQELQLLFETRLQELHKLEYYAERRLRNLGLMDDKGDLTPWVFEG
ncbi:hypothetical protein KP509_11G013100 [Ceratopteris richardii]|uniref:Rubisco LSMT substrate-binding domain-containing protein n=1 Tax=Ceratopteris richardii TaxID=49495 RepID=A0A8T2TSZ1_CERRI|nr:hypothetical protein KP509_11G013100 [Ceratopteris richardii]KAH7424535.1 hypothetical protein KP509_11G013100 [Ceratopteris richardii]KAH7424536.1 hypothetical protein KP509_11G013100 [Ceratopteris richardii]